MNCKNVGNLDRAIRIVVGVSSEITSEKTSTSATVRVLQGD
jgi:hypothetical protein